LHKLDLNYQQHEDQIDEFLDNINVGKYQILNKTGFFTEKISIKMFTFKCVENLFTFVIKYPKFRLSWNPEKRLKTEILSLPIYIKRHTGS